MHTWAFAKGHGTGNDFVILLDRHGMTDPSPEAVRYLCDRHRGIGGDGLLRVVPGHVVPEWSHRPEEWFMDYRNADGSVAEMCGNGARVFARFLLEQDLVTGGEFVIGTRAGEKQITVRPDGQIRVGMGTVTVGEPVTIRQGSQQWQATAADVGNPHAVVPVSADELTALDLSHAPSWEPEQVFPAGVNIEFVVPRGDAAAMRVHERGVGETLACGTGTVAVAAVLGSGVDAPHQREITVPGGVVTVDLGELKGSAREAGLTGPAVIVADGEVRMPASVIDDRPLR